MKAIWKNIIFLIFSTLSNAQFEEKEKNITLTIKCMFNCYKPDISQLTRFSYACKPSKLCTNLQPTWSIEPEPEDFVWLRDAEINRNYFTIKRWTVPVGDLKITAKYGSRDASQAMVFEERFPSFEIECDAIDCERPDPKMNTTLNIKCKSQFCKYVKYTWEIKPMPDGMKNKIVYGEKNLAMTIKGGAYKKSTRVVAIVREKEKKKTFVLDFVSDSPSIEISCKENCRRFTPEKKTVLTVTCFKCRDDKYEYEWSTDPSASNTSTSVENQVLFTIPEMTFIGENVAVTATAGAGELSDTYNIRFQGICNIEPEKGFAGDTLFLVTCDYKESINMTIMEHYEGSGKNPPVVLYIGPAMEKGVLLSEGSPIMLSVVVLPYEDQFRLLPYVEAYQNSTANLTIKSEILSDSGKSINRYIAEGDYTTAIQLASAVMDDLGKMEDAESKNHYKEHVLENIAELSDKANPEQLLSLLHKVVTSEDETNAASAEFITDMLKTVAEKISTLQNENMNSLQQLSQVAFSVAADVLHDTMLPLKKIQNETVEKYDVFEPENTKAILKARQLSLNIIKTLEIVGKTLSNTGEPIAYVQNDGIISSTRDFEPNEPVELHLDDSESYIQTPSSFETPITMHLAVFNENPILWHPSSNDISTEVVMLNLYDSDMKKIEELTQPMDIYIRVKEARQSIFNGTLSKDMVNAIVVHRFEAGIGALVDIDMYWIDAKYKILVTEEFPTFKMVRTNGTVIYKYRHMQMKLTTNLTYIALARMRGFEAKYLVKVTAAACLNWHGDAWDWSSEGCETVEDSTSNLTHCRCKKLSLFSGSFYVAPNKIDYISQTTFSEAISRSALVLIALFVILLIWTIFMVWAAIVDKRIEDRRYTILDDNVPGDKHPYIVEVVTGPWKDAGTSATVAIQLVGADAESRVHILKGSGLLNRGNRDLYVMHCPKYLGKLLAIRLFHDSEGLRPHWFCDRVIVHHAINTEKYAFLVQRWFSLIYDDGEVYREIKQTTRRQHRNDANLFAKNAQNEIREDHLWLSVFEREPHSSFTSKERISVAAAVLLLSMVTSAMFFGIAKEEAMDREQFGFSTTELSIVVQSVLITLPISILITVLFRKSRPSSSFGEM